MEKPSLYAQLRAIGAEMDNHESHLYVKHTPEVARLVLGHNASTFYSDGALWYDVPFAYDPWWERRACRG